jgi:hypothetical protein
MDTTSKASTKHPPEQISVWVASESERRDIKTIVNDYTKGRSVIMKNYNQFNGRSLYQCIDDWQKRWNGYIPGGNPLLTDTQSRVFLNITRNLVISYLAKIAQQPPDPKVDAVNKKSGLGFIQLGNALQDLNTNSLNNENGDARYFEAALECATKGTVIVYEGYAKTEQDVPIIEDFDPVTGEVSWKKGVLTTFDDCFQQLVPIEDLYIPNPYQADIQKQPFVIWRTITTKVEAEKEYGHYKNFEFVVPGNYQIMGEIDPGTFYRNAITTTIEANQVEIVRWYNRSKNKHIVMINGIIVYSGPIPFKHCKYPFAKTIFEPFDNYFFWGAGFPNKIMGEQDLVNTLFNMGADKTFGSLLPTGISSDVDDWIDDDVMEVNKFRKVGDINKWKVFEMPPVNSGEMNMLQQAVSFMKENAGTYGGAQQFSPRGGKVTKQQLMLQEQQAQQSMSIPAGFMEDLERDRTELRVKNMLQFYSIPRIDRITDPNGKEVEKLAYRDIRVENVSLADGRKGTRVIKLVADTLDNEDEREKTKSSLDVIEHRGNMNGEPTEAVAIDVDTFQDFDYKVQIVRGSTFKRNHLLDQAVRHDYANWRLSLMQLVPVDAQALVDWVDESHEIDPDQFKPKPGQQGPGGQPQGQPGQPPQGGPQQNPQIPPLGGGGPSKGGRKSVNSMVMNKAMAGHNENAFSAGGGLQQ